MVNWSLTWCSIYLFIFLNFIANQRCLTNDNKLNLTYIKMWDYFGLAAYFINVSRVKYIGQFYKSHDFIGTEPIYNCDFPLDDNGLLARDCWFSKAGL